MNNLSTISQELLLKIFDHLEDGFHHPNGYLVDLKNTNISAIKELFNQGLIKIINPEDRPVTNNKEIKDFELAYLSLSSKGIEKVDTILG